MECSSDQDAGDKRVEPFYSGTGEQLEWPTEFVKLTVNENNFLYKCEMRFSVPEK
jgi:hypothetical protein